MARLELPGQTYINKQGKKSHRCEITSWADVEQNPKFYKTKYHRVDKIPCGQCMECRLNKARQWANRIVLEKQDYPEEQVWFLTLTYDDEHVPFGMTVDMETGEEIVNMTLKKEDEVKFMHDLRQYYQRKYNIDGIRFYMAGEYGSTTNRPHYHYILYGLPLDQTKLKRISINELGQTLWTHEEIEKIWNKGMITIGRVTWESACYVARYCTKKITGKDAEWYYKAQGIIPPFTQMSRRPGIGANYLEKNKDAIYTTDSIPIANKKTASLVSPPKSFDRIMEKYEPEFMEQLKRERRRRAELNEAAKFKATDLTPTEWRYQNEEKIKARTKSLVREL
ncbi:replication initiator protein [Capybara microvirus Cap1_SP_162]|nr:replication initiator protein [Capybara microvirus Cap1_SP_162]